MTLIRLNKFFGPIIILPPPIIPLAAQKVIFLEVVLAFNLKDPVLCCFSSIPKAIDEFYDLGGEERL